MQHLLQAVTANGDSAVVNVAAPSRGNFRVVKVDIVGGTATVKLYGRMSPADANWAELASFTASGVQAVVLTPQVKMTVSSISGATVDGFVDSYAS